MTEPFAEPPRVVGFRLTAGFPGKDGVAVAALLTIEHGPWVIAGYQLCTPPDGKHFLRPPRMRDAAARVTLKWGEGRAALRAQALHLLRAHQDARAAEPPLATASEPPEARE